MLSSKMIELLSFNNLLTVSCTALTTYLSYLVLYEFTVTMPTSTSKEQIQFDSNAAPNVVICVDPAFDNDVFEKYGYKYSSYHAGEMHFDEGLFFVGWNGVDGKHSSEDILNETLNVKTEEHLIWSANYKDGFGGKQEQDVEFLILQFPYGRCILVRAPTDLKRFKRLELSMKTEALINATGSQSRLKIFLLDPINSHLISPMNDMKGDHIEIPITGLFWNFFVRVSRSHHVQEDPLFECKEYDKDHSYGECVQNELKALFKKELNCTPPLLAQQGDPVCNTRFNVTREEGLNIRNLFDNNYFHFEPSVCKRPCIRTTYSVQKRENWKPELRFLLLQISFDSVVEVTRSKFSTNLMTVLVSVGGSVSKFLVIISLIFFALDFLLLIAKAQA